MSDRIEWEREVLGRFLDAAPAEGELPDYINALTRAMLTQRCTCTAIEPEPGRHFGGLDPDPACTIHGRSACQLPHTEVAPASGFDW